MLVAILEAAAAEAAASSSQRRFSATTVAIPLRKLSSAAIVVRPLPRPFRGLCQRALPVSGSSQKISP